MLLSIRFDWLTVQVFYRVIPIEKIPYDEGDDAIRNWLYKLWVEKDQLLKQYYQTGRSLSPSPQFIP